ADQAETRAGRGQNFRQERLLEHALRRRQQIFGILKRERSGAIESCSHIEFAEIPVEEARYQRSLPGYVRHAQVIACGHAPRRVDDPGGSCEEVLSEVCGWLTQSFV